MRKLPDKPTIRPTHIQKQRLQVKSPMHLTAIKLMTSVNTF